MRTFLLTALLFSAALASAQNASKSYTLKEVGWTLQLPASFSVIDPEEDKVRSERGKKEIEDANNIQADISKTKTLISALKNQYNYFNATITPFDPATDGNFQEANQSVFDMVYKTFHDKMPDAQIDTASQKITIDGLGFDGYQLRIRIGEKVLFTMYLMTRLHKGYDFGITYLYVDEATKEEIEQMLRNSKFSK